MIEHELVPTEATTTDVFDASKSAVLSVEPGSTVKVRSLDASGSLRPQLYPGEKVPYLLPARRGHCLTGPIEVRGAMPGSVLAIHFDELIPDAWGWTVAGALDNHLNQSLDVFKDGPGWILWTIDHDSGIATSDKGFTTPIAPFLGVVGLPPAVAGEHSTIPPRTVGGGNIDCRELVAGSTLYLPITVEGAMVCLGDGHAAQGDGEVGGTAIECPMTTVVRFELLEETIVKGVHATTPAGFVTFGFNSDLNVATTQALDAMLAWMTVKLGLSKVDALALASVGVDLRITQIANQTWGVHALLSQRTSAGR